MKTHSATPEVLSASIWETFFERPSLPFPHDQGKTIHDAIILSAGIFIFL